MSRFRANDVVWAKNAFRRNAHWPALVVEAEKDAPLSVKKCAVPGRCCLMFYGPSKTSNRNRDWYWREEEDILPWTANIDRLKAQQLNVQEHFAFNTAIAEAQSVLAKKTHQSIHDQCPKSQVRLTTAFIGHETPPPPPPPLSTVSPNCIICQKKDGNMIRCEKCGGNVHMNCDLLAIIPARAVARGVNCVYFCASCRGNLDEAEIDRLTRDYGPELQTLNTASVMMNCKIESSGRMAGSPFSEAKQMSLHESGVLFSQINGEYTNLIEQYQQSSQASAVLESSENGSHKRKYVKTSTLKKRSNDFSTETLPTDQRQDTTYPSNLKILLESPNRVATPVRKQRKLEESLSKGSLVSAAVAAAPNALTAADRELLEKEIPVICNSVRGLFHFFSQRVRCECEECLEKPEDERLFTATHFEQHCGAGTAKKWKASVRIRPGSVPEVPAADPPLPLGRWFAMKGLDLLVTRVPASSRRQDPTSRSVAKPRMNPHGVLGSFKEFDQVSQVEVKPWDYVRVGGYMKIHVRYAGDRCSVCDADVDYDCDQLISCDKCGIAVHQTCYGVHESMSNDRIWLCNVCRAQGTENAECCLCPIAEGARKPTTIEGLWCHVACMQWIPEVTVENPLKMERISRIEYIQKERWELNCCFCKQKMGAKIQCATCYTAYHPLCARIAGMHMEMKDGPEGYSGPLDLVTYCPRHAKPHPELSGIKLVFDQEDDSRIVLCNRQPYPEPPAVEVPCYEEGCARTQALKDWERKSHGSGSGFGSNTGFWIPDKPPFATPGNWKRLNSTTFLSGKLKKGFGRGRHHHLSHKKSEDGKDDKGNEVLLPVDLLPLPEGVQEEIKVECNGVSGVFVVRSQRVMHLDQCIPAAKFEQFCGRGDAKKWKASLWYVNGETDKAECQMQVWLTRMALDRNVLAKLQTNQAEYDAYHHYLNDQVTQIVHEMMDNVVKEEERTVEPVENRDQEKRKEMSIEEKEEEVVEMEEDSADVEEREESEKTMEEDLEKGESSDDEENDDGDGEGEEEVCTEFNKIEIEATSSVKNAQNKERNLVGEEIIAWDECRHEYLAGKIVTFDPQGGEYHIQYNNGDLEWKELNDVGLYFDSEKGKWLLPKPDDKNREMMDAVMKVETESELLEKQDDDLVPSTTTMKAVMGGIPEKTEVFCNGITATFLVKEMMIVSNEGLKMTPRDFERAAGKGASKKWKNSIKVRRPDGRGFMTVGDWFSRNGCITQKPSGVLSKSNNFQKGRKSATRLREYGWMAPKHRRQRHQAGCLCIVCRQSKRRSQNNGLNGRVDSMDVGHRVEPWQPATTLASVRAQGPGIRYGKRAFVQAVPYLVGGIIRHELHEIPQSKSLSLEKWMIEAKRRIGHSGKLSTMLIDDVEHKNSDVILDPLKGVFCKSEKWNNQLRYCQATEHQRVTFGKSGIHGWGLFSLVSHPQDSMIIEYKGEIVTPAVADMREKLYREKGMDCYLFHMTDTFIIDATVKGAVGRFINHCCAPSMYVKAIQVEGKSHLCFFARYNIKAGQELTYDYRFKEEIAENKLLCHCGAPNCRGYLN